MARTERMEARRVCEEEGEGGRVEEGGVVSSRKETRW